ncbi:unnamed protein product [Ectocarpus sp. 12 AP-2014]
MRLVVSELMAYDTETPAKCDDMMEFVGSALELHLEAYRSGGWDALDPSGIWGDLEGEGRKALVHLRRLFRNFFVWVTLREPDASSRPRL